jgi:CDP-paratose 2-epimerase
MSQRALVTGSSGLIGGEAVTELVARGWEVVGIDNDSRSAFFGPDASNKANTARLLATLDRFRHVDLDIRDQPSIFALFEEFRPDLIIHAAAQPSHDWAARDPFTDFDINARATLILLEATRHFAADSTFVYMSTNKVYGDKPNELEYNKVGDRFEPVDPGLFKGFDEGLSIDYNTHSLFGVSKLSADLLVQEYGRYFGMKTGCFRGGCLTGPNHSGTHLHGFLSYLVKSVVKGDPYTVVGYDGYQVRDNIHSYDLVTALLAFAETPTQGAVYNIGGTRKQSCSVREALAITESICGRKAKVEYNPTARIGDHIWWISDMTRFESDFPHWGFTYTLETTIEEIVKASQAQT